MRKPARYDGGGEVESANKGAWSKQEDEKLISYIHTNGEGCWRTIPQAAGLLRCGKSCRLRWVNYLKPGLKRGNFSDEEEDLIIKLHALLGNRWSLIAGRLPGRTDNEVKNYWNTHIRRKLLNVGIDPNNHRLNQTLAVLKKSNQPQLPKSTRNCVEKMASKSNTEGDRVSDSGSCLMEDFNSADSTTSNNTQLPDLNLDLNLMTDLAKIKSEAEDDKSTVLREDETHNPSSPTLLLFT